MSFREKLAWICLVTTILVFVPYFAYVFWLFAAGEPKLGVVLQAFVTAVVIQIVLSVVANIAIAAFRARVEPPDERDRAIDLRSLKISYYVLAVSVFLAIGYVLVYSPLFISQMMLLCFVAAEVARYSTQAVCYRTGC